jgi:lipopolysaccharide heptosyltransferase II
MAQSWVSTPKKRLMVAGLNLLARAARPWLSRRAKRVNQTTATTRILVVELWNIGDIVLTMPFLAQLRALFPGAEVTLLARPHARELLEGSGLVDEFLETELTWTEAWLARNPFAYDWRELRRVHRQFRGRDFDIAFQCRMHIREHLILALSGAGRRVGYAFGGGDRVLTDAIPVEDPDLHKAADWLRLLGPFGEPVQTEAPTLRVSKSEYAWAREYLAGQGVSPSDIVVGVHPGASVAEKRWPLERFHETTAELSTWPRVRIIAFTEPGGYGASLGEIPGVIGAKVGLRELIALISRCDVLVCNDSGPMHIAGVLGVPTVAVFGAGIDRLFSPLGAGHELLSPELRRPRPDEPADPETSLPLTGIRASRVIAAVKRVLERRGAARDTGIGLSASAHPGSG